MTPICHFSVFNAGHIAFLEKESEVIDLINSFIE